MLLVSPSSPKFPKETTDEMENRSKNVVSRLKTSTSSTQPETVLLSISSDGSNFPLNSAKAALSLRRAADDLTGDDGRRPRETRIPPTGSTRGRSRTRASTRTRRRDRFRATHRAPWRAQGEALRAQASRARPAEQRPPSFRQVGGGAIVRTRGRSPGREGGRGRRDPGGRARDARDPVRERRRLGRRDGPRHR